MLDLATFDLAALLPFILIGFAAQLVDGALGMAFGFDADARDVGLGLRTCTHANEKFLSRQRFFATIAPRLTEDAHRAVGVRRLSRAYAAVKLAGGVPASVALIRL